MQNTWGREEKETFISSHYEREERVMEERGERERNKEERGGRERVGHNIKGVM